MSDSLLDYKITGWMTQFKPDEWAKLDPDERLTLLQESENRIAAEECREARTIVPKKMDDLGLYDPKEPSVIYIKEDLINTTYLDSSKPPAPEIPGYTASVALSTVLHEGRHAFQDDCINGCPAIIDGEKSNTPLKEHASISDETVELWRMQNFVYFSDKETDKSLPGTRLRYYFQPVEDDAEDFAIRKLQEWANQLDDPGFSLCCSVQVRMRELIEEKAAELWQGLDYREYLKRAVKEEYEQILRKYSSDQEKPRASVFKKRSGIPAPPNIGKDKCNLVQYALSGGILLYLLIMYLIAAPSGFVSHLLWFMATMIPFLPVILLLRFFPKLHNKKGGILLSTIFCIFLLLVRLFYSWLSLLFLIGTAWTLLKGLGSAAPNILTITRENADGTTTTETRILGDNTAMEIAGVKDELRREGYTDIREG